MAGRFSKLKMLLKGLEGAAIAGGAGEALVQGLDVDVSNLEHAVGVVVLAAVGFAVKAIKNYIKNR